MILLNQRRVLQSGLDVQLPPLHKNIFIGDRRLLELPVSSPLLLEIRALIQSQNDPPKSTDFRFFRPYFRIEPVGKVLQEHGTIIMSNDRFQAIINQKAGKGKPNHKSDNGYYCHPFLLWVLLFQPWPLNLPLFDPAGVKVSLFLLLLIMIQGGRRGVGRVKCRLKWVQRWFLRSPRTHRRHCA